MLCFFKNPTIILISLTLAILILFFSPCIPIIENFHWKFYGILLNIKYKFGPLPSAIKDFLLVTIDNETLKNIPERWPYPRAYFAKAIDNLKKAKAKVIAFDFVFLGKSSTEDDNLLKNALLNTKNVVVATAVNEEGDLDLATIPELTASLHSGIISKLQDSDGITRRNLTYLVNAKDPKKAFLSWEMQVLKVAKNINLSTFISNKSSVSFQNDSGEKWIIPVDIKTESFLIHFRAHSTDFPRLSFYRLLNNDFDPALVKDKIVLVGLLSNVFMDLHYTPLGWLPGLTLAANSLLTLYTHDFLKNLPRPLEIFVVIIAVIVATILASFKIKGAFILIVLEILLFFILSYVLLMYNYIWNYSIFVITTLICPFLAKQLTRFKKPCS